MLHTFFDPNGQYHRAEFAFTSGWPEWSLGMLLLGAILVLYWCWRNTAEAPFWTRLTLLTLRFGALVILGAMCAELSVRLEKIHRKPSRIVVLVDQSRSMTLPAGRETRLERVSDYLSSQKNALDRLSLKHHVEGYGFGSETVSIDLDRPPQKLQSETDFVQAFQALGDGGVHHELVGVILISDGIETNRIGRDALSQPLIDALAQIDVPIYPVSLFPEETPPDLSVADVAYDEFAFVRNAISFEASIQAKGHGSDNVEVKLFENGRLISSKSIRLQPDKEMYDVVFEFVPQSRGQSIFKISVSALPGEAVVENNHRSFVVQMIRDKIRVLQVVGRPSWDVRSLRSLLKRNPNVDLVSFFILRTNESIDSARTNELSLIPFPTNELFYEELGSFDLVVFQNFTYRGFRMGQYLPRIRDFVENGGGFVMVGGEQSFAHGGYANTPLSSFLPVVLSNRDQISREPFVPELTDLGVVHPITRLIQSQDENLNAWRNLAQMNGFNGVAGVSDGASVLLRTSGKDGGQPFVAVRQFGQGRVLAVLGDDTWRWSFGADGQGTNPHFYYRFWGNAIRWLIQDPALNRMQVSLASETIKINEMGSIEARLLTPSFLPQAGVSVRATVTKLGEENESSEEYELEPQITDLTGTARFRTKFSLPGAYLVTVRSVEKDTVSASLPVLIEHEPKEYREIAVDQAFLEQIAVQSQGRMIQPAADLDELSFKETESIRVDQRKDVPLWSNLWILLVLSLFLGSEWFLRRRHGMA